MVHGGPEVRAESSVPVGAPVLAAFHSDDPQGRKNRRNALLVALSPAAFGDPAAFTAAVDTALGTLEGLPAADDADGVSRPGERGAAPAVERAANGVPVASKVWRELTESAAGLGVVPLEPTPPV
ncbi:Ldh family oxidoreductase [Streptomyces sp. JNUCC 63]